MWAVSLLITYTFYYSSGVCVGMYTLSGALKFNHMTIKLYDEYLSCLPGCPCVKVLLNEPPSFPSESISSSTSCEMGMGWRYTWYFSFPARVAGRVSTKIFSKRNTYSFCEQRNKGNVDLVISVLLLKSLNILTVKTCLVLSVSVNNDHECTVS